jgi:hypothetical protein
MATGASQVVADHHVRVDRVSSKKKRVLLVVANPTTSTTLGWPVSRPEDHALAGRRRTHRARRQLRPERPVQGLRRPRWPLDHRPAAVSSRKVAQAVVEALGV